MVVEVAVDAATPNDVVEVVGVCECETAEDAEVGLNEVESGGLGRGEDGPDAEPAKEGEEAGVVVDIVQGSRF
jgi:hypothetical protein